MADQKISQLAAAAALTGTELVPIVQSSSTVSTTASAIRTYAVADLQTTYGFATTPRNVPDMTATAVNTSQIGRILVAATGGIGVNASFVSLPVDSTPSTAFLAATGPISAPRAWMGFKSTATGTPTWREIAPLDTPVFSSRVSIGTSDAASLFGISTSAQLTSTVVYGSYIRPVVQSTLTTNAYGSVVRGDTAAAAFTLASWRGYTSLMPASIGAGSSITTVYGYIADSSLGTDAAIGTAYGYYSTIVAGTNRWALYMQGSANSYFGGPVGIGTTSIGGTTGFTGLRVDRNITGTSNTNAVNVRSAGTIQSDITGTAAMIDTFAATQATSFTLSSLIHYRALQGTFGAGSAVTTQEGYRVDSTLIGATNNYGFRGSIPSGTSRYNLYMDGTAANYINGNTGFGTLNPLVALQVGGNDYRELRMLRADATGNAQAMVFAKARGTETAQTIVSNGDTLGSLLWNGNDGSGSTVGAVKVAASIVANVDAAPSTNIVPGRLVFSTTDNAGTSIERMRISSAGTTTFSGLVAKTTANTLTAAGTNLATALALTAAYNVVTSAAAGTGVSLPNVVGARIWVFNNQGTNAINVYPPTGTLNGSTSVSLAANGKMQYVQIAAGVWYTMS